VVPKEAYLTAEQFVDAAMKGFDKRELITIPSLLDVGLWDDYERARERVFTLTQGGQIGRRYQ
jgi:hypothetical protein